MLRPRRHLLLAVLLSLGFMACKSTKQTREDAPIPTRAFWPMKQSDIMRTGYALAPNLIERPAIAWKAKVGLQTRHNSPVVSDDTVYTGSAGEREGEPDAMDGVYALDLTTGKQRWFTPFQGDVHGTSWLGGNIIVTAGKQGIWALDASTGERRWSIDAAEVGESFASPLVLEENGLAVVGTLAGEVLFIDGQSGQIRAKHGLPGKIRGGAASDGTRIFVATDEGFVVAFSVDGEELWRTQHHYRIPGSGDGGIEDVTTRPASIVSEPTVAKDLVILIYEREEALETPPWFALDRRDGTLRWEPDVLPNFTAWTSLSASPSFAGELLAFNLPESTASIGFLMDERRADFISNTPTCNTYAWASSVRLPDAIYHVRMDGMFYAQTDIYASVIWHAFLGKADIYPKYPKENRTAPGECREAPLIGRGIASTPAVARDGGVLVGTLEGYMIKLEGPPPEEDAEASTSGAAAPE